MKKVLILFVMLAHIHAFCFSQTSGSWTVNNTATWIEAVNGIRSGGNNRNYTITVSGNVSIPASSESTFGSVTGTTIIIQGNGILSPSFNGLLLDIVNGQTVVAKDVTLRGRSDNGSNSVVRISRGGSFRLEGIASVTGNTSSSGGGGVSVRGGTFSMHNNSTVKGNSAASYRYGGGGGGGVSVEGGSFTMQDNASISGNTVTSTYGSGGGVYVGDNGSFTLQDNASVSDNVSNSNSSSSGGGGSGGGGGGVAVKGGTFTMLGGVVSNNSALNDGKDGGDGGGVYISDNGSFIMHGGTISGNSAAKSSGGVNLFDFGNFTMHDGVISGNTSSYGGGVSVRGTFVMNGGIISNNTAASIGGGVYMYEHGNFTMQGDSSVSHNLANSDGGGVYIQFFYDVTFTLQGNASISHNISNRNGGGVCANSDSSFNDYFRTANFTIRDNASISNNKANYGGGICFYSGRIIMEGGVISGNFAYNRGGGVYINGGTLIKTGGTIYGIEVSNNLANQSGRGHAVNDNADVRWRNSTANQTMNTNTYGFWLNEEETADFPSSFLGTWKRNNYSNTLTFTRNTLVSSSSSYIWSLLRISGDSYTITTGEYSYIFTFVVKLVDGRLEISGDSGTDQDNWNGTWLKQ
ncbi:MAG: hypothetical protein LBQ94_02520 [Treponema sp.]|jgi:hypothetical protein|nr:hypothetical protein [Treponema sp.]